MVFFYILVLIPITSYLYGIFLIKKREKQQMETFSSTFGKEKFSVSSLPKESSGYWEYIRKKYPDQPYVDATTWHDLSMDEIFMQINNCHTSPGEEMLFATLHQNNKKPTNQVEVFEQMQQYLLEHPDMRIKLQTHLTRLGKSPSASLVYLFASPKSFSPYKQKLVSWLGYAPLLSIPLIFVNPVAAFVFLLASAGLNLWIFFQFTQKLQFEHPVIAYLNFFLHAVKQVFNTLPLELLPEGEKAEQAFSHFKNIAATLSRVTELNVQADNEFVMMGRFMQAIFLRQVMSYNKGTKIVQKNLNDLYFLYEYFGNLDMAISIAAYRQSLPYYCLPEYHEELVISTKEVYHPLLPRGVANNLSTERSIILTGSNASGKSTFLKTIAINAIFAHSINTCCADGFSIPNAPVYTSMAISDSIFRGESYFIAEIKSIKRILSAIELSPCLCFIDEILRGTNTIERIAASTAILEQISTLPCLCMVATHDIELTEIFKNLYAFYHFREILAENDILFDYKLYSGPSKTKNAIELLNLLGFEKSVTAKAKELALYFEEHNQWIPLTDLKQSNIPKELL